MVMDPECEAIVLFISTTKWSIKVTSIDRRTPPNTSLTVYVIQFTAYRSSYVRVPADGGRAYALPSPVLVGEGLLRRQVVSRRHRGAVGLAIVSQLAGWQATHANA